MFGFSRVLSVVFRHRVVLVYRYLKYYPSSFTYFKFQFTQAHMAVCTRFALRKSNIIPLQRYLSVHKNIDIKTKNLSAVLLHF